jgi:hypothetical protein
MAPFTLPRSVSVTPFKPASRVRKPSASSRKRSQIGSMPSSLAWSVATFKPMTPAKERSQFSKRRASSRVV